MARTNNNQLTIKLVTILIGPQTDLVEPTTGAAYTYPAGTSGTGYPAATTQPNAGAQQGATTYPAYNSTTGASTGQSQMPTYPQANQGYTGPSNQTPQYTYPPTQPAGATYPGTYQQPTTGSYPAGHYQQNPYNPYGR
jgi:hypothetical protein